VATVVALVSLLALGAMQSSVRELRGEALRLDSARFAITTKVNELTRREDSALHVSDAEVLREIADGEIQAWAPTVDLHATDLQRIGDGYLVGHLSVGSEPGGTKLAGIIVNGSSLTERMAQFTVASRGVERTFTVSLLPAGGSARFSVDIPGLVADSALTGTIRFLNATVDYR